MKKTANLNPKVDAYIAKAAPFAQPVLEHLRELVHTAMTSGPDNHTVSLKTPLPIVIFYATAWVEEDGQVHFFDDIYGYDAEMEKVLAKGPPYPMKPYASTPKTKPGDTM